MIKKTFFLFSVMLCFLNMQCDEDDISIDLELCDQAVVIDENAYNNLESAHFTFFDTKIIDNCLSIEITSSGCSGDSWEFKLVDSGAVAESSPEQRYLKFQLINEELCDAVFNKTVSFDLTPIQISGSNEIILNIEGLESSLNYSY